MKKLTQINFFAAGILWLTGLLELLFNLFGLWGAWHLAGFACYFCIIPSLAISVSAFLASMKQTEQVDKKACILRNGSVLVISVVMSILSVFVFSTWFW